MGSAGKVLEADTREARRRKAQVRNVASGAGASNRGRRGRKRDFPDAERLVKRLVARELTLSFVPDAEQRLWRTVTRKKYQLSAIGYGCRTKWSLFWKRPGELRPPMEVWFYSRIGTAAERPTPRARKDKDLTPALLPSASGELFASPQKLASKLPEPR
jgi:hypothetical protein